jgi:hypothetical protein
LESALKLFDEHYRVYQYLFKRNNETIVLRKNSMPLSSQRDLTFRIASSRSFVSWLETLLVADVYSPDRIFADHRIDA